MKIELSHDILAKKIGESISGDEKEIRKISFFISKRFEQFKERGDFALLKKDDMDYINPYLEKLSIDSELRSYLEKSKKNIHRKLITVITIVSFISLVIFILFSISFYKFHQISEKKEKAEAAVKLLEEKENKLSRITEELEKIDKEQLEEEKKYSDFSKEFDEKKKQVEILDKEFQKKLSQINQTLQLAQNENKTQEEEAAKKNSDPSKWSSNFREMSWTQAKEKCSSLGSGWRLPAKMDWININKYHSETAQKWVAEGTTWFWTRDEKSESEAFGFFLEQNVSHFENKEIKWNVRCIRR